MAKGGYRAGAGRPKGSKGLPKQSVLSEPKAARVSPLEYMLRVMNDAAADPVRRDRMAIAAAPFVHARAGEAGKKEDQKRQAATADRGTEWAGLLQ